MESLISAQQELSNRIARTHDNLRKVGAAKITLALVHSSIALLDKKWSKFEEQHDRLREKHWEELKSHDYWQRSFIAQVEEVYLQQRTALAEIEQTLSLRSVEAGKTEPSARESSQSRTSLPRIQLPQFTGKYEDWPAFRDLFTSLISKDKFLSNIEKLHYLRASVKGTAEQLIRSLPMTDGNFERAWTTLSDHYENKRLLVRSYFSSFLTLPKMKSESSADLRRIFHGMVSTVGSLEGIGRPISSCSDLFVHLVVELLDVRTRRDWEREAGGNSDPSSYEELHRFMESRLQTLEVLSSGKSEPSLVREQDSRRAARALHAKAFDASSRRCPLCSKNHFILFCDKYKAVSAKERKDAVSSAHLCFNCLGRHQLTECKSSKSCSRCAEKHHTSLHDAFGRSEVGALVSCATTRPFRSAPGDHQAVLLATARVKVTDRFGRKHEVRALIDPGSETSLVAEALVQRLRVLRSATSVSIMGVGEGCAGVARGRVSVSIGSRSGTSEVVVSALVLPRLTSYGERLRIAGTSWPHLDGLELADPDLGRRDPVELLLGVDVFSRILMEGVRRGRPGEPVAQRTTWGWIVSGECRAADSGTSRVTALQCSLDDDLSAAVRRLWEQEEPPRCPPPVTPAEQRCLDHFAATHSRRADGRYIVRLPLATHLPDLSDTRQAAWRMMQSLDERFRRDHSFQSLYSDFMAEYERLGHMSPAETTSGEGRRPECFLPHHGVLKRTGESLKLRVVFNGSERTRTGLSLNGCLLTGPSLLPRIDDVLLRWRRHRFVFVADVEKMYRQILMHEEDRHLQGILWRSGGALREYRLNTVTYGLASAPFLAIRTMHQLAEDESTRFPLGAAILRSDVYVDDILAGASTISDAVEARRQLEAICMAGGFPLRKWAANREDLLSDIPAAHCAIVGSQTWHAADSHSTLGLEWRPSDDTFAYEIRSFQGKATTKRTILSQAAQLFDPLGWMAPVIVRAKCIIQSTWLRHVGWDAPLPEEDVVAWEALSRELPLLRDLRIPRWVGLESPDHPAELHGFADASEHAYAAALYLRSIINHEVRVFLLRAKTRVAPLKQVSLPRLELCAACLLVAVTKHTLESLRVPISAVHLWTDSTVTLGWIQGHPGRWTTFVANRVAEIQRELPDAQWHHVPGKDNPADCASRGVLPGALVAHPLWWHGPSFLVTNQWPLVTSVVSPQDLPERRKITVLAARVNEESEMLTRHSSLARLLRVSAWMRRWHPRWRVLRRTHTFCLTPEELRREENYWISHAQLVSYALELKHAEDGKSLPGRSKLLKLTPFKDRDGLLRVGGRLKHALLSYEERHPIILPPDSHLTGLIIDAHHRRVLHGGVQMTLGLIRRRFWIPRGRQMVRQHIHRCPPCIRWRAASPQPFMSSLPRARVAPCRPFLRTGIDYAGPILLRASRGRGHQSSKAFIAIFVCLSSRAVHLEVVSDYSTQAFLAAFRRFTSRRGTCHEVFSDRGTNFVGADAELRALFRAATPTARTMADQLASNGTRWYFNPPGAPHFGGLWEAAVKSTKHHLRRVIGDTTLTFEEMTTLLTQVEACLNSRPLQAMSDDPEDLTALTPGHFLIGEPLCSLPEPSLELVPPGRLSRWQLLQQMRDHLWRRWSQEYLASLASRSKWCKVAPRLEVGQLCLLRSELTPPSKWPLGRITELHRGDGGHVRVVSVRTATSSFTRPVVKIVPLPAASASEEEL